MQQLQNSLKIGITGLGLIGGSIYKSFKESGFKNIFIHTTNSKTAETIKNDGFIVSTNIAVLNGCDLIFVCSPISETTKMIKQIWSINNNAIYIDVASLKADILSDIENTTTCKFIGSHPMAGTENSGFDASMASLFNGAKWVLTPSKFVSQDEISFVRKLIETTGAKVLQMDAIAHDKAVALISHAPMLVAQGIMQATLDETDAKILAASGFRDMTRLALSNKVMAKDMLTLNKANIKEALENIIKSANALLDDEFFADNIDNIIDARKSMYNKDGKNIL